MSFDPEALARLAEFARELDAPEGETFDELQQAREDEAAATREALRRRIAELDELANQARESAAQATREYRAKLAKQIDRVRHEPRLTRGQRNDWYRDLERGAIPADVFYERELQLGTYYSLRRKQQQLKRELAALENEG